MANRPPRTSMLVVPRGTKDVDADLLPTREDGLPAAVGEYIVINGGPHQSLQPRIVTKITSEVIHYQSLDGADEYRHCFVPMILRKEWITPLTVISLSRLKSMYSQYKFNIRVRAIDAQDDAFFNEVKEFALGHVKVVEGELSAFERHAQSSMDTGPTTRTQAGSAESSESIGGQ